MKSFRKFYAIIITITILIWCSANLFLFFAEKTSSGRPYRVEISRIAKEIEQNNIENVDLSKYHYVTNVAAYSNNSKALAEDGVPDSDDSKALTEDGVPDSDDSKAFYENTNYDYCIRQINGTLYRFDYIFSPVTKQNHIIIAVNIICAMLALLIILTLLFIRQKILKPFHSLCEIPYELSRGNLTSPIKENKNRYFGRFLWGINMLREKMEQQKQRELQLQRDKKTLLLSLSHDIKTPLSAIKLYAKALSKGLYPDSRRQLEIAESINEKANEIERFVSQIVQASREDFLNLEVIPTEFYLHELIDKISYYYEEKLSLIKTNFILESFSDCLLKGDLDRSIEVLQNIIENAIKYGDGHQINITFSEEEDCQLITIKNSGCTLSDTELPHIFDSFWRGSNVGSNAGSGLGLSICRQIMHKMNGEIFAEVRENLMCVTLVFGKAG